MSIISTIMLRFAAADGTPAGLATVWLAVFASAAIKGALLFAAAGVVTSVARRAAAATRHLVWTMAIVGALGLPLLSAILPAWRTTLPALPAPVARVATLRATPARADLPRPRELPRVSAPAVGAEAPPVTSAVSSLGPPRATVVSTFSWEAVAAITWAAGVAAVLLPLVVGTLRVRVLSRDARPADDETWAPIADALPAALHLSRQVRMIESDEASMPMTWGVLHPVVLLPAAARTWPEWQRRNVLLHELAHVRRYDCLTQLLAHLACAIYWFNPLCWVAAHRLRVEGEHACDDQVLLAGSKATDYAAHLLDVARSLRVGGGAATISVAMARPSQLGARLHAVLDRGRARTPLTRARAAAIEAAALALAVPLAAFAPSARVGAADVNVSDVKHATETARLTSAGGQTCSGQDRGGSSSNISHSISQNDTRLRSWMVNIADNGCAYRINALGDITFNADASDVTAIPAGGYFTVEVQDGDDVRRAEIRPLAGRELEHRYLIDGHEQPWGSEAKAWLAESLLLLDRHSAFAAESRVPNLLARGGVDAVLNETAQMRSDYARRRYFSVLVSSTRVNGADLRRVLRQVAASMGSDYEIAELLIALSKQSAFDGTSDEAYVRAAARINSDYERRRALTALLERGSSDEATTAGVADAALPMHSDYEKAELLIAVARRGTLTGEGESKFFVAARSIKSAYEERRTLSSVLSKRPLSKQTVSRLLEVAPTISSDYELAELLVSVAHATKIDETLKPAYVRAANGIKSEYEHRRALAAIR